MAKVRPELPLGAGPPGTMPLRAIPSKTSALWQRLPSGKALHLAWEGPGRTESIPALRHTGAWTLAGQHPYL